jgi:hypothetical protein
MSMADQTKRPPPAAPSHAPTWLILFAVFGGPLAWFLQLNADFALASNPCFFDNERSAVPHLSEDWTWSAMVGIALAATVIALAASLLAWRAYRSANQENVSGRTRFLASWGISLGAGSALLILLMALAFFVLPRCAG